MAMDSSSDQRTDLTSRGLSRAGETGKTRIPRAAKAARVRLYSSIILGRMPPGGQQAVGEHRGEAELLLEGAH